METEGDIRNRAISGPVNNFLFLHTEIGGRREVIEAGILRVLTLRGWVPLPHRAQKDSDRREDVAPAKDKKYRPRWR